MKKANWHLFKTKGVPGPVLCSVDVAAGASWERRWCCETSPCLRRSPAGRAACGTRRGAGDGRRFGQRGWEAGQCSLALGSPLVFHPFFSKLQEFPEASQCGLGLPPLPGLFSVAVGLGFIRSVDPSGAFLSIRIFPKKSRHCHRRP